MRHRRVFGSRGIVAVGLLALAIMISGSPLARPPVASAHPLGNFTINRYSRIEPGVDQIQLRYVLDLAEIPTFQEMSRVDLDRDGRVSESENTTYSANKAEELRRGLQLSVNGEVILLDSVAHELSFPPGQGGLSTMRLSLLLRGQLQGATGPGEQRLDYRDDNYSQRLGWKEIVVRPGGGVSLVDSTVPQQDRSNELRSYPMDLLDSPSDDTEARATFVLAGVGMADEREPGPREIQPVFEGPSFITSLVTAQELTLPVIVLALVVALGLGAVHALSPGHGKTIMAAYLVGTRGTAIHAMFLGLTVTISHTLGVLGLGLLTLYASHLVTPERLYPWLGLVSGGTVIAIGLWLLIGRMRDGQRVGSSHHHQTPGYLSAHNEAGYNEAKGDWPRLARFRKMLRRFAASKIIHGHTHEPDHHHPYQHNQDHAQDHRTDTGKNLKLTWKSLAALGVVGGLVPSVSALVILLAAILLHRVGFGLLLILAFSGGMAVVLTGIGLLLVYTRRLLERVRLKNPLVAGLRRLLPLAAALIVLISGLAITVRAMFQVGVL